MDKFDPVRMQDLVRVDDPDPDGGVTLAFKGGQTMKVGVGGDGKLVCTVSGGDAAS